jgi:hypothetical protein
MLAVCEKAVHFFPVVFYKDLPDGLFGAWLIDARAMVKTVHVQKLGLHLVRATGLGEFSPLGRLLWLGSFLDTKVAQIFGLLLR